MSLSLIGELTNYDNPRSLYSSMDQEGWGDVSINYIGGLSFLLSFRSKEAADVFRNTGRDSWGVWFNSLSEWTPSFALNHRIAVISITGLLPQAWIGEAFSEVARLWGDILHCRSAVDSKNRDRAKVVILTHHMQRINEKVAVNIDNWIPKTETEQRWLS
ncbi:hypothetical protein LXL04_021250 [Taraxacum kok-saghyz]